MIKIIQGYQPYNMNKIEDFVSSSTPNLDSDIDIVKGEECSGWVEFTFKHNNETFKITHSLAVSNLTPVVLFFESIINLKEGTAIFLDDECISEPLFYISPIDDSNIRFLIARRKATHDDCIIDEIEGSDLMLSKYIIKSDVITDKTKLLNGFCRAVKNIISTHEKNDLYYIDYEEWKDNYKHIISYSQKNK